MTVSVRYNAASDTLVAWRYPTAVARSESWGAHTVVNLDADGRVAGLIVVAASSVDSSTWRHDAEDLPVDLVDAIAAWLPDATIDATPTWRERLRAWLAGLFAARRSQRDELVDDLVRRAGSR